MSDSFAREAVLFPHGFIRICATSPQVEVANPAANLVRIDEVLDQADADIVLLPELSLTGYTCGDLFLNGGLIESAQDALLQLARRTESHRTVLLVGLPILVQDSLMNVAAVIFDGQVRGLVPKSYLP
ncbi:MAG: hypothetical protein ACPHL6_12355, partial [Rubripirellula sp.]